MCLILGKLSWNLDSRKTDSTYLTCIQPCHRLQHASHISSSTALHLLAGAGLLQLHQEALSPLHLGGFHAWWILMALQSFLFFLPMSKIRIAKEFAVVVHFFFLTCVQGYFIPSIQELYFTLCKPEEYREVTKASSSITETNLPLGCVYLSLPQAHAPLLILRLFQYQP